MTPAEADAGVWAELAENLEGAGYVFGLCACLYSLWRNDVISGEQFNRMDDDLYRLRSRLGGVRKADRDGYFWPVGAVAPRVAACRKLAKLTALSARAAGRE